MNSVFLLSVAFSLLRSDLYFTFAVTAPLTQPHSPRRKPTHSGIRATSKAVSALETPLEDCEVKHTRDLLSHPLLECHKGILSGGMPAVPTTVSNDTALDLT